MYRRYLIAAAITGVLAAAPIATWACQAAGQNVHVGKLMAIDAKANSFTIFDVETANAITFASDEKTLKGLQDARGMVQVHYERVGDVLKALEVRY
jgi:hypothetical protein